MIAVTALAAAALAVPSYRHVPCPFTLPAGARVDCGRLTVQENRTRPGRTISLAVAVYRSRSPQPRPDPVLWLTGGPGGAGLPLAQYLYPRIVAPFLAERDMIVFDQRGTGRSRPALTCGAEEKSVDCVRRWKRAGVDLAAYTSAATADDVEDLRGALGIRRWNLFGESYGTRTALTILRDHPGHVRSAIVDSVVPPNADPLVHVRKAADAFRRLVAAAAPVYPRLDRTLRAAAERSGPELVTTAFFGLYEADAIPQLPRAIDAAARGIRDPLWQRLRRRLALVLPVLATGTNIAVTCNEEAPFATPARVAIEEARYPDLAPLFSALPLFDACREIGAARAPAREHAAVRSSVPTLVLAGGFDPVTPVANARLAARTLSHSRLVVFPTLGHWLTNASACARRIESAFLDAPLARPDTSCVPRSLTWATRG